MDAWAALWFWPLTDTGGVSPPSLDEWIETCQALLGREPEARRTTDGVADLGVGHRLGGPECGRGSQPDLRGGSAGRAGAGGHAWLRVCEQVARQQGFFHWELDFATVFAGGGFDLQLGNPPWVRPQTGMDACLPKETHGGSLAVKPSEAVRKAKRDATLAFRESGIFVTNATTDVAGTAAIPWLSAGLPAASRIAARPLPLLHGADLEASHAGGVVTLVHPESHFTDEKAALLREHTYRRLRRHWQFINELKLYEIQDQKRYGVHVYGRLRRLVNL